MMSAHNVPSYQRLVLGGLVAEPVSEDQQKEIDNVWKSPTASE